MVSRSTTISWNSELARCAGGCGVGGHPGPSWDQTVSAGLQGPRAKGSRLLGQKERVTGPGKWEDAIQKEGAGTARSQLRGLGHVPARALLLEPV